MQTSNFNKLYKSLHPKYLHSILFVRLITFCTSGNSRAAVRHTAASTIIPVCREELAHVFNSINFDSHKRPNVPKLKEHTDN